MHLRGNVGIWALSLIGLGCFAQSASAIDTPLRTLERDGRSLYLRTGTVNTRQRPSLLGAGVVFNAATPYVLQLDGPMTSARRAALTSIGVHLGEYLPMNAYLVDLHGIPADKLSSLGFIAWIGQLDSGWKTSPDLGGTTTFQTAERKQLQNAGRKRVAIQFFHPEDAAAAVASLQQLGANRTDMQISSDSSTLEVDLPANRIASLKNLSQIKFVEESAEAQPRNDTTCWITQTNIPNNTRLWDMGLHGEDQIAAVIDWNLVLNHCAFKDPLHPTAGPDHRKVLAYTGSSGTFAFHGTHVCGVLAGYDPAESNPAFKGQAYMAKMIFMNNPTEINSTNLFTKMEINHNQGARVHNNSWGNSSRNYIAWSRDIDLFSRTYEDDVVVVATTNSNVQIQAPENAKNCLAINANGDTPSQESYCFGGFGPTTDGRQKPELFATGCGSNSASDSLPCGVHSDFGTSYAAPVVSAMVLLTRQYFMEGFYPVGIEGAGTAFTPSGALIRALLVNSGSDMAGFGGYFSVNEGWGRVLMDDALYFDGDSRKLIVQDVRNVDGLSTNETDTYYIYVASSSQSLKVTIAWSDAPAALMATFTPVNNLNLVVTDPNGVTYLGNHFTGSQTSTGGSADVVNNIEEVLRASPEVGIWKVEVTGGAVAVDTQGYGLVVTGDVETSCANKGDVNFDSIIDGNDIIAFVDIVLNGGTPEQLCAADMNSVDGPDENDVDAFVTALLNAP